MEGYHLGDKALVLMATLPLLFSSALCLSRLDDEMVADGRLSPRVFNGNAVKKGEFPFLALINNKCAGAIVGPHYILTTADCVDTHNMTNYLWLSRSRATINVSIADHLRMSADGEINVKVANIKIHPAYEKAGATWRNNNIALLKTETEMLVNQTAGVGHIDLRCAAVPVGAAMTVIGWGAIGYTDNRPTESSVPVKAEMNKLRRDKCECYLEKYNIKLANGTICASADRISGAICSGDGGAPLVLRTDDGRYELVGLASTFKQPCVASRVPAVFTDVSRYIPWILENQS